MLEGTGARAEIWHGDTGARGHGMLEGTGARDEIWHGDTGVILLHFRYYFLRKYFPPFIL